MTKEQEMQNDIEYWVEECSYEDVVDALIDACQFFATMETDELLHHTTPAKWGARVNALRQMLWEDQHNRKEMP
jgi:hypothetical protein